MSDIQKAFDRLLVLIESEHIQYNLFLDNDDSHCCELGMWGIEPDHRDVTVSAWGDSPAEAVLAAVAKWGAGEQYEQGQPYDEFQVEISRVLMAAGVDSQMAASLASKLATGEMKPLALALDAAGVPVNIVKAIIQSEDWKALPFNDWSLTIDEHGIYMTPYPRKRHEHNR